MDSRFDQPGGRQLRIDSRACSNFTSITFRNRRQPATASWSKLNGPVPPALNHGALFGPGREHKRLANGFFAGISLLAAGDSVLGHRQSTSAPVRRLRGARTHFRRDDRQSLRSNRLRGVQDFLYFYLIEWPVFNIADCCLVCGAGCLLYHAIFMQSKAENITAEGQIE